MKKKIRYTKFQDDLQKEVSGSPKLKMLYEIESVKLKLAMRLTEARESMGLTQAALARKMGVSQQLISRIESGDDNITLETLVRFLYMVGVSFKIDVEKRKNEEETLRFVA